MIPKIIHYCWFGNNKKPEIVEKCIKSWSKMEGYRIIEWNENNCNFNENNYLKSAYENREWAFVSDYIRLKVLYEYGGIYLDTDVEIKKKFDNTFLINKLFISFMFDCNLSTAVIGSIPKNENIKNILDIYENLDFNISPNNDLFTRYFLENYPGFKLNNKCQQINGEIMVYSKEYFECPTINKKKGYSIHHFEGSWRKKSKVNRILKLIFGNYIYSNIIRKVAIYKSPFYDIYLNDRKL